MTIAYWCVLVVGLLPYLWTTIAKAGTAYDNRVPRAPQENVPEWRKRALWAHYNAFEALPLFSAAVIIAQQVGVTQGRINGLALAFVGFRVAHGLVYIAGFATLRSLVWAGGLLCVITLFVSAA